MLVSGGGSALLTLPAEGITLEEKQETTRQLLNCGATIDEINSLRKHLSRIKGGRLAIAAYPATVECLMISDVVGNRVDVNPTPFYDVLEIRRGESMLPRGIDAASAFERYLTEVEALTRFVDELQV